MFLIYHVLEMCVYMLLLSNLGIIQYILGFIFGFAFEVFNSYDSVFKAGILLSCSMIGI